MINVGFIGAGNMGFAIMNGVCKNNSVSLYAYDIDVDKIKRLDTLGVTPCESVKELIEKCKYVFLAVKPQQLDEVLCENGKYITEDKVIVSICAGITGDYIKSKTIINAKTVLVMPNTPLLLGEGATALAKVEPTTDEEFQLVCEIFRSCGKIAVVDESKMKEIIAVNGSSPAFIYLYSQAFINYAQSVGIDENVAKELFAQTLIGSAKMITDSGYTIDELITMVSSKGGTTIAGLEKLREGELEKTVENCCKACVNRAYELSK